MDVIFHWELVVGLSGCLIYVNFSHISEIFNRVVHRFTEFSFDHFKDFEWFDNFSNPMIVIPICPLGIPLTKLAQKRNVTIFSNDGRTISSAYDLLSCLVICSGIRFEQPAPVPLHLIIVMIPFPTLIDRLSFDGPSSQLLQHIHIIIFYRRTNEIS